MGATGGFQHSRPLFVQLVSFELGRLGRLRVPVHSGIGQTCQYWRLTRSDSTGVFHLLLSLLFHQAINIYKRLFIAVPVALLYFLFYCFAACLGWSSDDWRL